MRKSTSSLVLKLASVAAAVSVFGVAHAQAQAPDAAKTTTEQSATATDGKRNGEHYKRFHRHHHHQNMQRAAMIVPGYGPISESVVSELNLTEEQQKLLQEAQSAQMAERKNRFEALKEKRAERLAQLQDGKVDPRAALQQSQQSGQQALERRNQITEKWLAVWDSLDEAQQKKVTQHFSDRAQKRAERLQKKMEKQVEKGESDKAQGDKAAE